MIDISVILCCYNGRERLRPTLEHLAKQKVATTVQWELIFVDNASTDGSADYAQALWKESCAKVLIRIVTVKQPGLIFARKAGVMQSNGKYIIFCDDDNWLQEDYLQIVYDLFTSNSTYGAVGGKGIGVADVPLPEQWAQWDGDYACGEIAPHSCICDDIRTLFGAGLAIRRELLLRAFATPLVSVGRDGDKLTGGDDQELCYRVMLQGYHLCYDERLVFQHYMPVGRLNEAYHTKMIEGFLAMVPMFEKYRMAIAAMRNQGIGKYGEWLRRIGAIIRHQDDEKYKLRYCYYVSFAFADYKRDDREVEIIKDFIASLNVQSLNVQSFGRSLVKH